MAISNISLTASARNNLLSLQETSNLISQTQERLASGKKVNSAIDNATAFFASASFIGRANDFSNVKDSIGTALQTVKAASNAIDSISKVVNQLQGITTSALQTTDTAARKQYASQFNDLRNQIDNFVNDAVFNGTNLLKASNNLSVNFNESAAAELTIASANLYAAGLLNLTAAATNFGSDANINTSVSQLTSALTTLRDYASRFGNNATLIETRQNFTDTLVNALQVASDNLILADINEEGANLQALQARTQLGVVSLGISGQQSQAILRLF